MAIRTPLCDLLGIDVPIANVGFGDGAVPELAAAVSEAGGLGVIGAGGMPPEHLSERIRRTRELTSRPFGVNVIIAAQAYPEARPELEARIEAALAERVPVLVLFWGDPEPWEVLPRAVEALRPLPVLASGGIGDGAAIARALALGAQGVSLGTRFVASAEAYVRAEFRARVVASGAADTCYGDVFDVGWPGAPHRMLRNRTVAAWEAAGRPPSGSRPGEAELVREAEAYSVTTYSNDAQQTSANTTS